MNKIFLALILSSVFLSMSSTLFSATVEKSPVLKIQGSKEMPLELNLIIQSLQENIPENQIEVNNQKLLPIVMNIDSYARALSKEDIFLVGKIEIYKTLLKTNSIFPKAIIDGTSLVTLKDAIKKSTDPFIKWFLESLLHDCESLLSSSSYKEYLLQKNNGKLEKLELRKFDRKVQLIYRWISKINPESTDFQEILRFELNPVILEALHNIEESFFLMSSNSVLDVKPVLIKTSNELKFFSMKAFKPTQSPGKKEKSVQDILAPLTDEDQTPSIILPKPSNEDWLNNDNAPANLKNLPKPVNDADWLQDL